MLKIVVFMGFLVAFAAGLVVGMKSQQRFAAPPTTRPSGGPGGWLVRELNLNAQQQKQLEEIWSKTAHRGRSEQEDHRRQLRGERDAAIAALIRPEDKEKYDAALKNYSDQMSAMEREFRGSFHASVEKTKEILTPEQRRKYEEILSRHQWDRDHGDHGPRDRDNNGRRGEDRATSRPVSQL